MADEKPGSSRSLRSVGEVFGDLARRVTEIVAEVSETVTMPEPVRNALSEASATRSEERWDDAQQLLRDALEAHPSEPHLLDGLALGWAQRRSLGLTAPEDEELQALVRADDRSDRAANRLLDALDQFESGDPERTLDALRRAARASERAYAPDGNELRSLGSLVACRAHLHIGDRDRAIREIHRVRAQLPARGAPTLRRLVLEIGAESLAAEDRLLEAERWLRETHRGTDDDDEGDGEEVLAPRELALLARIHAARSDQSAAESLLAKLPDDPTYDDARIRVGILSGNAQATRDLALVHLRSAPDDPTRLRLWALAEARTWEGSVGPSAAKGVIDALRAAARAAPPRLVPAHLQELAGLALRADQLDPSALELGRRTDPDASPERVLFDLRAKLADRADVSDAFDLGPPVRLPLSSDLDAAVGPDELSPLRDPTRRGLEAQRNLTLAEFCLATGRKSQAEAALVAALVESPDLGRATALMGDLLPKAKSRRLEDALGAATELLAGVPASVLGVPLAQVPDALARVIAARERLARPLTIAIMGEFSSGKSTFVNALLGEDVAPTGALPTTSTINVFRQGPGGGARIHYRDGKISTVEREQVHAFLQGLDATEASRIRYVEIERTGARLGDAAVVDTPGLNALDAFHERVAREFIEEADAVVWIFSATRSGAASEVSMLSELREGGRQVLGILNKVDTLEGEEQKELSDYLRQQLGEVLVGVVPLSATRALEWRTNEASTGDDPFQAVDAALEQQFLRRARELKRDLTTRRFNEALSSAHEDVSAAVSELERRANVPDARHDPARASAALERVAQSIHESLLELDDLLVRECLALGVVSVDDGLRGELDVQDVAYLDAALEEATLRQLNRALAELPVDAGPTLPRLVSERFVPWARGYLSARTNSQLDFDVERSSGAVGPSLMADLLDRHGRRIQDGEAALREGFRAGLRRIADDWRRQLRALHRELQWATFLARRRSSSEPRAEALRLRSSVLAGLEALGPAAAQTSD
jgi:GTPase SAR1 family protein